MTLDCCTGKPSYAKRLLPGSEDGRAFAAGGSEAQLGIHKLITYFAVWCRDIHEILDDLLVGCQALLNRGQLGFWTKESLRMSFVRHLEELHKRILLMLVGDCRRLYSQPDVPQGALTVSAPGHSALTTLKINPPNLSQIEAMEALTSSGSTCPR